MPFTDVDTKAQNITLCPQELKAHLWCCTETQCSLGETGDVLNEKVILSLLCIAFPKFCSTSRAKTALMIYPLILMLLAQTPDSDTR